MDDRRVISGIMHMLRSGGRWKDCPVVYGPTQDLQSLEPKEPAGRLGTDLPRPDRGERRLHRFGGFHPHQGSSLCCRRKRGLVITPLAPRAAGARPTSTR
ncbi:transposase [Mesorhizobium sp. 8]|nr:transposase [Mesorhizobium sp. 8]